MNAIATIPRPTTTIHLRFSLVWAVLFCTDGVESKPFDVGDLMSRPFGVTEFMFMLFAVSGPVLSTVGISTAMMYRMQSNARTAKQSKASI